MKGGDTFLYRRPDLEKHLWIVLSEPLDDPDNIVLANLTTWRRGGDQACILDVGDHPWIMHRTCVNYSDADVVSQMMVDGWELNHKPSLAPEVLAKVREGAAQSIHIPLWVAKTLRDLGLIE